MSESRILVTGASGFVGGALVNELLSEKRYSVICGVRDISGSRFTCDHFFFELERAPPIEVLHGVDTVVHAAARVHVMSAQGDDELSSFRAANVEGTLRLAEKAAQAGVKRFIFISSIKVNGESTFPGRPFTATDVPGPVDAYGISKREAEDALKALSERMGMEVVIIRPPLVYGPGVKANFLNMLCWVERGFPLPLGSIANQRSMVSLANLVDLIIRCINHPAAPGNTFLVSDGQDLSTTQLLRRVAHSLGVKSALIPFPQKLLTLCLVMLGQHALSTRLCGSLQVDIGQTCKLLGWAPPVKIEQSLDSVTKHYLETKNK
jgi:nucleoside-diphosphate-sugar epimerase